MGQTRTRRKKITDAAFEALIGKARKAQSRYIGAIYKAAEAYKLKYGRYPWAADDGLWLKEFPTFIPGATFKELDAAAKVANNINQE